MNPKISDSSFMTIFCTSKRWKFLIPTLLKIGRLRLQLAKVPQNADGKETIAKPCWGDVVMASLVGGKGNGKYMRYLHPLLVSIGSMGLVYLDLLLHRFII